MSKLEEKVEYLIKVWRERAEDIKKNKNKIPAVNIQKEKIKCKMYKELAQELEYMYKTSKDE